MPGDEASLVGKLSSYSKSDRTASINSLEHLFKTYFQSSVEDLVPDALINTLLVLSKQINSSASDLLLSTEHDYPQGHIILTKALVYLIETYGIDQHYHLSQRALAILKDYRILDVIHANNHQLIYEINRVIKKKKDAAEILAKTDEVASFLDDHLKTRQYMKRKTRSLARFLYYVDHPLEDMQMEKALNDMLEDFNLDNHDLVILHAYMHGGRNKWYFLNTIYQHYRIKNPLGLEDFFARLRAYQKSLVGSIQKHAEKKSTTIDELIAELKLVDKTYVNMKHKTKRQAMGMMFGGFAFGMEIAMLALENLALMSVLGAWGVLGVSFAACVILGTPIALYFHSAHYDELEKHNQYAYFHQESQITSEPDANDYGRFIAKIGTVEEGAAAACLLLTLGAFMAFDMITWGIKGGDYTSALPGLFFAQASNSVIFYIGAGIAGLALIGACLWVASCLASAHYALDGKHTIEYYDKNREEAEMRGVINKETAEPLYFSSALLWRHKIDDYFAPQQALQNRPALSIP